MFNLSYMSLVVTENKLSLFLPVSMDDTEHSGPGRVTFTYIVEYSSLTLFIIHY